MTIEQTRVGGRRCFVYCEARPSCLLIQPIAERGAEALRQEAEKIAARAGYPFALAAFEVEDWNRELSPWDAPPVFGSKGFGHGAGETLDYIVRILLPAVPADCAPGTRLPLVIGGYSLAGLFALWAAYQTDRFAAVAAASPSVWFPGWMNYARAHAMRAKYVYLSLGDREERARNPLLATVGKCVRGQYALVRAAVGDESCALEWNAGNHFADVEQRCARAFGWCIERIAMQQAADIPIS